MANLSDAVQLINFKSLQAGENVTLTDSSAAVTISAPTKIINADKTIYVTAAGNDSTGDGTVGNPYLTIQKAINDLKDTYIDAAVTINVGAGNFGGFALERLHGSKLNGTLTIVGASSTSDSGTVTSSTSIITSGTLTYPTVTDTTKSWTANQWKGKWIQVTSGAQSGLRLLISENTSNTLTVLTSSLTSIAGAAYNIIDNTTNITSAISPNPVAYPVTSSSSTGQTNVAMLLNSPELFNLTVSGLNVNQLIITCTMNSFFRYCTFDQNATLKIFQDTTQNVVTGANDIDGSYEFFALASYIKMRGSFGFGPSIFRMSTCLIERQDSGSGSMITLSAFSPTKSYQSLLRECVFDGNNSGIGWSSTTGSIQSRNCTIKRMVTGINLQGTLGGYIPDVFVLIALNFDTCTTAISTSRANFVGGSVFGSTVVTAYSVSNGAKVQISSTSTLAGSTSDIVVDAVPTNLISFRANTPKIFPLVSNSYNSYVYE